MQVLASEQETGVGDPPEFDAWVAARGQSLLRLAHVLTGNRADAEDVVQDALSRALPRWPRISTVEDPDAYVRRMVVNAHISWWRKSRRRESPVAQVLDTAVEPAAADDAQWQACRRLPEPLRTAVVLRFYEDMGYAAIAALTGVREGSVRSRVSRGLALLKPSWEGTMSDFEDRVRSALTFGAAQAPLVDGLAASARGRLRKRRRTTLVALAAALVVATIPVGFAVAGGGGSSAPAPPVASQSPTPVAGDWRWESYRDVEFQVPADWANGNMGTWCIGSDVPEPVVERPVRFERSILCSPKTGYGVRLGSSALVDLAVPNGSVWQWEGSGSFPDGSWLSIVLRGDVALHVVADARTTALHIAQSVRVITDVDSHGCAPVTELDADIVGPPVLPSLESADDISVCEYDVSAGPHLEELLVRSDRLSDDASQRLLDALRSASAVNRLHITCPKLVRARAFLVHLPGGDVWVNPGHDCRPEGILDGGDVRHLTSDVLYALSTG